MFTFLGHAAVQGCSRCKKSFPGEIGARDCSGFNREDWNPRENEEHRSQMEKILKCNTAGEKEKMESLYGTRFSVLFKLHWQYAGCSRTPFGVFYEQNTQRVF